MTDQHPLTDDKCYELWSGNLYENERMRAAADWQLKQVIEWIKDNLWKDCYLHQAADEGDFATIYRWQVIKDLQEAMRPTNTQENN